jgi:hypothetical protein
MEKLIIKQVSNVLTDEHVFVEFEGTEWTYRQVAEYLLLPEVKYCFVVDGHDVTDAELDDVCQQGAVLFVTINGPAWPAIWLAIKAVGAKIAAAYAAKGLLYYAVNAAIMTAISYGINAIFAPKPQKPNLPSNDDLTSSPSYGWNPAITQQEGVIVPKYYGTMVANSGNVITAYRDMDGVIPDVNTGAAREAIRCAVSYGFGPIKGIREVKINDQYLDENTGLVVQRRYGFTSQARIATIEDFTTTEDTPGYNVSTTCALYEHPIPAGTHAYEVVLYFPYGLYQYRDDGSKEGYPAQFEMYLYNVTTGTIIKPFITDSEATITKFARWSYGYYGPFGEDASGNWTLKGWREIEAWYEEDLPYDMANYSNSVEGFDCYWRKITVEEHLPDYQATTYKTMTGPVYAATDVTFQFNLPYADGHSFKFYIRRIDAPDTLKQMASAYVSAIRYKTYRFTTYPRNVVLAISGIATERFNNDLNISAVIDGAIVNTYNGTSWTLQHSSNPAWIAWDVLTQPVYTNRSPIAENWGSWLGYDDILTLNRYDGFQPSQLNLNDFYAWAQFCDTLVSDGAGGTEKRFVANCVFDADMSLWDAVTKFCENYRALIYWNGSEIRLCGDFGATSVSQRFNDGNIIADSLSISYIPKDTRANEVELSYLEEGNDNKRTVLALYDPEIEGGNKSQVTLFGTTRASEAWRIGKYLLACNKYINRIVKFSTSYEALHSALGDVIEIQHSMPDWAAGGRIASYNSATKIFYIDGLLLGDSEYLAMGFSQATIDGWRAGGAGQVINNQVNTGLIIGIRTLNGAYAEYAVYGGGWLNGQTQIILPADASATGSPQLGDLYCLVGDVALQKFKITDISMENDNTVSITAVDYNEQIYVEADDCTGVTAPVLTLPDKFPNVTNITAATYAKLSAGAYTRALEVRWTIPISAYFAKVRVYLSYGSGATVLTNIAEFIGETTGTQYRLENAPVAQYYRVHVATVNTLGNEEPLSMCPSIGWEASDVNEVTIPYMATGVNELRVINSIGDGLTFNTPGCVIGWNAPEAAWADEKWLAYYEVNIYQTGTATVLHTAQVKGSREYTFAFDTNVACTGGPYRTFDIGVRAVDGLLNIGTEVKITAVNAQPMAVQNVTGNDFVGGATISWELLTAPDVAGYIVGYSANAGGPFMQLRQVGKDTASCEVYLEDGIWFFVVGGYDVFGTTGINYSTAISVAISHEISIANVVDFEEGLSDVYAVPIPRGVVWSVAANVLSWNAHEIIYSGTVYSIAAGSTSLASPYVYWQSLAGSYTTTASLDTFNGLLPTSNQWQIAINYGTYYKLAWVAQANQVIGSAWIGEAAIQNVNIGNEIWSNNFSYTPGSSMSGWKISKSGKIMANDLEIYASDGTLLIDGNWKNNWSSVIDDGGKPEDNATANNVFYQDSAPTGTYGDIWVRTTDNQIFTHDGAVWVEGKSGVSSLQVVLSNEAHTIQANSDGTVPTASYTGSGTTIKVYEGQTELTYDGFGIANSTWKITSSASGITSGTLTDSGTYLTVGDSSNMTTDAATITYTISGKTSSGTAFSTTKVQSFSKSKAGVTGATGAAGPAIVLIASKQAFTFTDNVLDASQADVTFTVVKHNTTETVTWTSVPSLVSGTGDSNTLSAASFGANTQVVVTVTTPSGLTDKITIVRLNKSTAAAGATVGATWGSDIANMPDNLTSYTENAVTKIYFPIGATHSNPNSSVAGAIKIVLPQGWSSTMLRFEVDVYTYSADKSFKLLLAGYNYVGGSWVNTTVGLLGSVASDNRVRFAYDSALGKCCILIGSTTADGGASSWRYPKVAVSNFQAGYGAYYAKQYWETGWSISIVNSLANITSVVNWDDALVDAKSTTYVGGSLATTVESNAAEAKADADSALSQLTDMASDSKLTPVEKQAIKVEWDGIVAEKTLYDSQANAFHIIAEKASYGTAYTTLSNYITPLLSSLTTTSTIVGTTFRANFASYYSARQTLLNKISSTSASVGPNICPNPDLKGDLTNNTTAPGWVIRKEGTPLYSLRYVTSDSVAPPWDRQQPVFYANSDSADDSTTWHSDLIPISETETYCLSAWVRQESATARVYLRLSCYASDGATLTGYCHVLAGYTGLSSTWTQYYDAFGPAGTLAIPANTRYCRIEWWGAYLQVGSSMATRFCLNRGTIPNNAVVPSDLVGLSNPITEANHGTYIKYLTADTVVAGALRGINVNSSSHTCRGTYLTTASASGNTTLYVHNTTDFGTSGSGYILDRLNDKDEFTWTGKTTTTLTGCSGVLDHNANATVIPKAPNIVLDKLSQELRIYGYNSTSNGYTACDQLVTLGIKDFGDGGSGTDTAIARFGNETFSRGLAAYFENNNPTVETVRIQNFQSSYNTNYSSLYVYGCNTTTQIGGYGIYGVGKRAIVAYGYDYDFYASGPGTNGPFTGSHDALLPNTSLAVIGDIVYDTLVVYRRNISNTLTSVDISEAPKVKSVMGVLNNILSFYITAPLQYNSLSDFLYATTVANLPATMYEDIYTNVSIDNWEDYAAAFIHYVNNYSYIIVNALGEGQINVVAEGGNIEAGDYICSSSTPGKGMKQDDDLLHNYTVAKAREDVTWTEEEIANNVVKMIACTYHCG